MPRLFKAVECRISALHCHECGYRDENVHFEQYPDFIDKKCPVCQSNLLTRDEYKKCKNLILATRIYNVIVFPIHFFKYIFSKEYRNSYFTETFEL